MARLLTKPLHVKEARRAANCKYHSPVAYWLHVDGDGSWTYGGKFYRGGPHEVPEETFQAARERNHPDTWLFVSDEKPVVPRRKPLTGALSSADLEHGTEDTEAREIYEALLAETAARHAAELYKTPEVPTVGEGGRIPCPVKGCGKDYASPDPLVRHLERKHPDFVMSGTE